MFRRQQSAPDVPSNTVAEITRVADHPEVREAQAVVNRLEREQWNRRMDVRTPEPTLDDHVEALLAGDPVPQGDDIPQFGAYALAEALAKARGQLSQARANAEREIRAARRLEYDALTAAVQEAQEQLQRARTALAKFVQESGVSWP